jgi:hypothetical protein
MHMLLYYSTTVDYHLEGSKTSGVGHHLKGRSYSKDNRLWDLYGLVSILQIPNLGQKTKILLITRKCHEKESLSSPDPNKEKLCNHGLFFFPLAVVYYESIKRELKTKPIYECRCEERLKI